MGPPNGHVNGSPNGPTDTGESALHDILLGASTVSRFTAEQIKEFVALLEIPFDPSVIEWRVTNTSKAQGHKRGQVIPYADQRAYTDRLNGLFTPAGWTRKYTVHTSANFQRRKDQKTTAKVFVTCDLVIFGLGSHSATGEEWADDENAVTSAEAQAFKRSCACFGLGRYLYHFNGAWVDLDDRRRPKATPTLFGWATPEGWRQGLRPGKEAAPGATKNPNGNGRNRNNHGEPSELVRQIEAMAEPLGRGLYRGLLKTVATAWKPDEIQDAAVLRKVLVHMQAADRGLRRLQAALEKTGAEPLAAILQSLNLNSLERVDSLQTLHKIVVAVEGNR